MTVKVNQKKMKLNYGVFTWTFDELFDSENSDNKVINEENVQEFSQSKFENILNLCKRKCARVLSSSKDENESILQDHQNEIADGTN